MSLPENLDEDYTIDGVNKKKIPNATTALVCGIISIPFAGLIGIILGIIALSSASGAIKKYEANPEMYLESSFKNAKAGQICGIIGVIASILWMVYIFGRL